MNTVKARFYSLDLTPRYTLKAARDYAMNFWKRSPVPKKRTFAKSSVNPVVAVRGMSLVSFTLDQKYLWSMEYGVRVGFTVTIRSVRS